MLPGVGVFGTGRTVRVLVPLLQKEGFPVQAVWGRTQEEAEFLANELDIPFSTSQSDDVLLHPEVHLVCILTPPPHTRQIAVKALGIGKNVISEQAATLTDACKMVTAARYYPQLMSIMSNGLRFLPAFVLMKRLLGEGYCGTLQAQEDRCSWARHPVSMATTFEDGLYVQTVVDAIKLSNRTGEWESVEVRTQDIDPNHNHRTPPN